MIQKNNRYCQHRFPHNDKNPSRRGCPWTWEEGLELTDGFVNQKLSIKELAEKHCRTIGGIESRLSRLLKYDYEKVAKINRENLATRQLVPLFPSNTTEGDFYFIADDADDWQFLGKCSEKEAYDKSIKMLQKGIYKKMIILKSVKSLKVETVVVEVS